MRTTDHLDKAYSKQQLRVEINSHVEEFLHKGGRINVVTEHAYADGVTRSGHWPAAADVALIPSLLAE